MLACFLTLGCSGCAYFRWGERSLGEIEQSNRQQREMDQWMVRPGDAFYTR